ncbi:dihydrolipoyl dehydrogenase family protein [Glaciibacter sp. 2TAF33]|uniref:dihydrolipoyl dehydrogenase family protein n=1 Tax=Glaciibacter sp. 2TAF33 TaxID=3233015 RepID=UPI003F926C66
MPAGPEVEDFDLVIVGGGKAGKTLAMDRAKAGRRVALVEQKWIGGTCINVACIPTKTLVTSARLIGVLRRAATLGVRVDGAEVDLALLRAHKEGVVSDMVTMNHDLFVASGMDFIMGDARFTGHRTVLVTTDAGGQRLLRGVHVVLNIGTRPKLPSIPGLDTITPMTSEDVLRLESIPQRTALIGGGPVGCELAQMLQAFGSRVTMLVRGDRLLASEEPELSAAVLASFRADGIDVRLGAAAASVAAVSPGVGVALTLTDGTTLEADELVVATGRTPVTTGIGLELAGIDLDDRGFVVVDESLATTATHTWAVGDVTGHVEFTHASYDDYRIVKANMAGGDRVTTGRLIPAVTFVEPELARVGLTEAEALAAGHRVSVTVQPVIAVPRSRTLRQTEGLWKIVVDQSTDRILGASLAGAGSGEVIAVIQTAMLAGAPYTLLRDSIFAHPTMAEGLNTAFGALTPVT